MKNVYPSVFKFPSNVHLTCKVSWFISKTRNVVHKNELLSFFCFTKYIFIYTIFFLIRINIFIRTLFLSWDNILSCSLTCQHNEIQQVIQHKSQFLPLSFYQVQFQISTLSFLNYQNYYLYQGLEQILFFHILSVLLCPNFAMFCLAFTLLSNLFWQPQILCFSRFHDRNL